MLLLVLVQEGLEVLMHCVQESVDFFQACLCQCFNLTDSIVNHSCQLMPLIRVLLRRKVEFVEDDLADLDNLLVR